MGLSVLRIPDTSTENIRGHVAIDIVKDIRPIRLQSRIFS